jgi:hypothetical protein
MEEHGFMNQPNEPAVLPKEQVAPHWRKVGGKIEAFPPSS